MLSIKAIGNVEYYLELAREDYYLEGGEPLGKWWGRATDGLSLAATTTRENLRSLAAGISPHGDSLVQNVGKPDRQVGWDLTFSAPKSVSVLWSHADPELRRSIQEAHDRAVSAAMSYVENEIAFTRRGKGGKRWEHAAILAATFQHGTSRALDPHLHTHALVLNLAARMDGTYGSLVSQLFYDHKTTIGTLYRVQLAYELSRLGFQCERDRTSFAVTGVPKPLVRHFSKRRQDIEKELASHGLETASAAAIATLVTREVKDLVPPRKELFRTWQEAGKAFDFTADTVKRLLGTPAHAISQRHYEKVLRQTLAEITSKQSHFSKRELLLHVARASQGRQLDAAHVQRAVTKSLLEDPAIVHLGERNFEERYTTQAMLDLEKQLLSAVTRLADTDSHAASSRTVDAVIEHYSAERNPLAEEAKHHGRELGKVALDAAKKSFPAVKNLSRSPLLKSFSREGRFANAPQARETAALDRTRLKKAASLTLSEEQARAIRHLTETPGSIKVLSGYAGTGKTFLLNACREIWQKEGYAVFGACLSSQAARELASKTGIRSDTLKMLQLLVEPELSYKLKHHARQLLRAAAKKPTGKLERFKPDKKTVLVIDEAGMIGTKDMKWLTDLSTKTGCNLVLTGEGEQIQPIDAGGPYPAIARMVGQAQLTEIHRQPDEREQKLVLDVRSGQAAEGLRYLADNGRLLVEQNRTKAIERLVSDWARVEAKDPSNCRVFCGTNRERAELNRRCQAVRAESGYLDSKHSMKLQDAHVHKGDCVILRQNSRKLGVQNGNRGTVVDTNRFLKTLTVELDDGPRVTLPLRSYNIRYGDKRGNCAVELGYATTTHSAQGATTERAYILAGGSMQDRELTYVQVSRHVKTVRMYTDQYEAGPELKGLINQVEQSRQKDLAHDVIRETPKPPDPGPELERTRC